MGGECSTCGGRGQLHTGFWWGNLRKKNPLGGPRRRWENNIKMELQEVGCRGMDFFDLAHNTDRWRAIVIAVINLRVA